MKKCYVAKIKKDEQSCSKEHIITNYLAKVTNDKNCKIKFYFCINAPWKKNYVAKNTDEKISCSKECILKNNMWEITPKKYYDVPKNGKKNYVEKNAYEKNYVSKTAY